MKIQFTKMEGSGNDFILLDNRNGKIPYLSKGIKRKLCSRRTGIGADGILSLQKDEEFPFMMRYFNADGSEADMCGNGARCIALYAFSKGIASRKFSFRSKSGSHQVEILKDHYVKVELPPCRFKKSVKLKIEGRSYDGFSLTVGVPHLVIFSGSIEKIDVLRLGMKMRMLKIFHPQGTNVDFVFGIEV